jgi:hypothetical protein
MAFSFLAEASEFEVLPVFPGAIDVREHSLSAINSHQVSYQLKASYPNEDALEFYKNSLSEKWVLCNGKGWQSFGDISGKKPIFIHQLLAYWANREKGSLIMLALMYESSGSEYRQIPESDIQKVLVIEYKSESLGEEISRLGLECST